MTTLQEATITPARAVFDRSNNLLGILGEDEDIISLKASRPSSLFALVGDSFAFNATGGNVGGMTLTRVNGVVTVTGAAGHPCYPNGLISVEGCASLDDEAENARVLAYISASSFTYAHPGNDGVIQPGAQSISIQWRPVQQQAGFFTNYNRFMGGGLELVANCGVSGAVISTIAARVSRKLGGSGATRVVGIGGYNDMNAGLSVATTVASWVAAVDAYPSASWDIFSPSPFVAGASADTAQNLRYLSRYYSQLKKAFRSYPNVRVHNTPAILAASSGYAATGMIKTTDKIHPSYLGYYTLAKYLAALDSSLPTPASLPTNNLDTRALDATSPNLVANPMNTGTTGGITGCTGNVPTGWSGGLTGTGAAGVASIVARADGFGSDLVVTYTPTAADWNLRASLDLTALLTGSSGGNLEKLVAKLSCSGFAGGNPANIKTCQMSLVWIADGITYQASVQEASGDNQSAAHVQQEDIVDRTLCLRNVPIPTFTALTLARLDFTINHYAAGTQVVFKVGRPNVELAQ